MPGQEPSGVVVKEVVPGSEDDPFSVNFKGSQSPAPASPSPEPAPASQPDKAPQGLEALKTAIDKQVEERLSKAQSGLNKQVAQMKEQVEATRKDLEASRQTQTQLQRQLEAANLSAEERERLQQQWDIEDERSKIKQSHDAVAEYHRSVEALRLTTEYSPYGFTLELIEDGDSLEDMQAKAMQTKIDFLEGKAQSEPAAASAPSDVGGGGPAPAEFKLGEGKGLDEMSRNIRALIERPEQTL